MKEEEEKKLENVASKKFVTKEQSMMETIPFEKSVDQTHAVAKKEEFAEKVVE